MRFGMKMFENENQPLMRNKTIELLLAYFRILALLKVLFKSQPPISYQLYFELDIAYGKMYIFLIWLVKNGAIF